MIKRTNTARWIGKRWRIDVQRNGQRKSFYSSKPGRVGQREANAKADAWLDDGLIGRDLRVEEAYNLWLETVHMTTGTGNYRNVASRAKTWVFPALGNRKMSSLNEQNLQDIINQAYAAGRSKKMLQNIAMDLRAFCRFCRSSKLSNLVPENLRIPAGARSMGKRILQPSAMLQLFREDTTIYRGKRISDPFINAYRFAVLTGLRPGELMGLRWTDIRGDLLIVQRAINVLGEETRGKNEGAVRSFVLTEHARAVLEAQKALGLKSENIFAIPCQQRLYKRWQAYCKANNIPVISLYELRHTFVSVAKTLPAGEVKALVGHSASMDTFGVYAHELNGDARLTANAIDGLFTRLLESPEIT